MSIVRPINGILADLQARAAARPAPYCTAILSADGDAAAVAACTSAGAYRACVYAAPGTPEAVSGDVCPRTRALVACRAFCERLARAGVPARERALLAASVQIEGAQVLRETAALGRVRALVDDVTLKREGARLLLALAGPCGTGKTVAAGWCLGMLGGVYLTAYQLRPGLEMEPLKTARLLVIDQLGREPSGAAEFAITLVEELVDARYANLRPTILCGNLSRSMFDARYQAAVADRLAGGGVFFVTGGPSLRKGGAA